MLSGLLLALVLVVSLAGCRSIKIASGFSVDEADWRMHAGDAANSNFAAVSGSVDSLILDWKFKAGSAFGPVSPLIVDETVLVSTLKGELYAIDLDGGRRVGFERFGNSLVASPAVTDTLLIVPNAWGRTALHGYDLRTGKGVWKKRGIPIESAPIIDDDIGFACDIEGNAFSFEVGTGEVLWTYETPPQESIVGSPILLGNRLIVANTDGMVRSLDKTSGSEQWVYEAGRSVYSALSAGAGVVLVPTIEGALIGLDAPTGAERWILELDDETVRLSGVSVHDETGIVATTDGRILSVNLENGTVRWQAETDAAFGVQPTLIGENRYAVGSLDGHLFLGDSKTGEILWSSELKGRIKSLIGVSRDRVIVLVEPRHVHSYKMSFSGPSS